jgi:hypothetical protein
MLSSNRTRAFRWLRALLFAQLLAAGFWGARAQASFAIRVLLVSGRGVSRASTQSAASALSSLGDLVDSAEYVAAAQERSLSVVSEEALSELAPNVHARLIVVLTSEHGKLRVAFRDGRSGVPLNAISMKTTRRGLDSGSQQQLGDAAQYALSMLQAGPPVSSFVAPIEQAQAPPPQAPAPVEIEAPPLPPMAAEQEQPQEELPPNVEPPAADAPAVETPETLEKFSGAVSLGFGFGQRSVAMPVRAGLYDLTGSPFPAIEIRVAADAPLSERFFLGVHFDYQTSVGSTASQNLVGEADTKTTALRSHRLGFGLEPRYRFSDSPDGVSLGVVVGWGFRGFRPVVDIDIPPYTLNGPVLRPELRIPIGAGWVVLRLAPELFIITGVSPELRQLAAIGGTGVALGIEASIDIRMIERLHAVLAFRESHATASSSWAGDFTDNERFASVSMSLRY